MTELEKCMESLIFIFHRYAVEDGDKKTLSKKELRKLMETELPTFLKTQKNPKIVESILKDLDQNKDDKLDFEEFLPLVVGLSMASPTTAAITELEKCMESLILVFHRYAVQDGDKKTLTKKELKELMEMELNTFLKAQKSPKTVDCILKDLDQNSDDKLDFEEFLPLIVGLLMACEKFFLLHQKKNKP